MAARRRREAFLRAAEGHSQAVRTHFADLLTVQQLAALTEIMEIIRHHLDAPPGS